MRLEIEKLNDIAAYVHRHTSALGFAPTAVDVGPFVYVKLIREARDIPLHQIHNFGEDEDPAYFYAFGVRIVKSPPPEAARCLAEMFERENTSIREQLRLAQEQLKWIDVKKETPKTRGMVIVCYKDGSIGTKRGADVTIEECDEWITHWKPLPAPPTKVEGST